MWKLKSLPLYYRETLISLFRWSYENSNYRFEKRNKQIVDYADLVIAFLDGKSAGTKFTVDYATKRGKTVKILTKKLQN